MKLDKLFEFCFTFLLWLLGRQARDNRLLLGGDDVGADLGLVDADGLELLGPLLLRREVRPRVGQGLHEAAEAVGDVDFKLDLAEQHGQSHWEVALRSQRDVPVAGLEILEREDPLSEHLVVVVVDGESQHGQLWQNNLERNQDSSKTIRMLF